MNIIMEIVKFFSRNWHAPQILIFPSTNSAVFYADSCNKEGRKGVKVTWKSEQERKVESDRESHRERER